MGKGRTCGSGFLLFEGMRTGFGFVSTVMKKSDSRYIKEKMDTIIIVTVAVLSYLYFWDFDEQG
jgi:hypothetical protein